MVMTELKCSRWTIYRWRRIWRQGGKDALRRRAGHGKSLGLGAQQWSRLSHALAKEPSAAKMSGTRWTLPLFAALVVRVSGMPCERTMAFRIITALGYRFDRPPPSDSYHVRRGPGKWIKRFEPTIPAHLLPPAGPRP